MNAVAWLPAGTRPPAALDALLAEVVAGWGAHWFVGPVPRPHLARDGGSGWRPDGSGLAIATAPDTALRIGARIAGVPAEGRTEVDRDLLERVAEPCLLDLRDRLSAVAGASAVAGEPHWVATLDDGLAFGLSDALFAGLCRRVLPPVAMPPPGSGARALAATAIGVGAAVGRAAMTLADLRTLEIGDVVVLDRAPGDPVPIAVDGRALPRGRVRIVPADPVPSLQIVEPAA